MAIAYLGLGSNLGDSLQLLAAAWHALGRQPGIRLLHLSNPYRTKPVGMVSSNWFVNAAGSVQTDLPPLELLECLLRIEEQFGRVRHAGLTGYQDRIVDFDLLLYEDMVLDDPRLVIPHPQMHRRLFVLAPLKEIAPDLRHPVLHQSIADLFQCVASEADDTAVQRIAWPLGAG